MKLLRKSGRPFLLVTAVLLVVAGCFIYFVITSVISDEITEKLISNKERVVKRISAGETVTQLPPVIEYAKAESQSQGISVKDTFIFDPVEEEKEFFRQVTSVESINGKLYRITLRHVILEPHDYFYSIGITLGLTMGALLLTIAFVNRRISSKVWEPFYRNLETLKHFSVPDKKNLVLESADIDEFRELNTAIESFIVRVKRDYAAQKEFAENASHEIQTPLSIIITRLEEILQQPGLSEKTAELVRSIHSAANRLSRLNKGLLMLTKLENRQFDAKAVTELNEKVEDTLSELSELIHSKNISLEKNLEQVTIRADPFHIEALLGNLIGNAIKHNVQNGKIRISLSGNRMIISNTGKPLQVEPEKLFGRFSKADASTQSPGLGLSIVKKICEVDGWTINYTTSNEWHNIMLTF